MLCVHMKESERERARVCVKKEAESVNAELTDFLPSTNSSFRSYHTAKRRRGNRIRSENESPDGSNANKLVKRGRLLLRHLPRFSSVWTAAFSG